MGSFRSVGASLILAGWVGVSAGGQAQTARLGIAEALDLFATGEHQRAVDGRPFEQMQVVAVIEGLEGWIGPADVARGVIAARFALDVAASREMMLSNFGVPFGDGAPMGNTLRIGVPRPGLEGREPDRPPSSPPFEAMAFSAPIVAWACARMPKAGAFAPWEPWWWLTSIAILQGAGERNALSGTDRIRYFGPDPPEWQQRVRDEVRKGHLVEAKDRIGAHPRVRLAEVVTRAASVTDATFRFAIGGAGLGPSVAGRRDVIRHLEEAARTTNSGRFNELERDFEALLAEPGLEGEVSLRIAQLRLLRRDWALALQWLDRVPVTEDRTFLATADYFRGWIFERTNRPAESLAAYRAAYARYDRSPNLNTLLAVQLMLAGERSEAARVLERSLRERADEAWHDLWLQMVDGDARHARRYARLMRESR